MFLFNVRVYGILINSQNEVLISDEQVGNFAFTKFPGGGLEFGEGIIDALKREYLEECNLAIEVLEHIYTTDFFEKSSFNESQIISIYYLVRPASGEDINLAHPMFNTVGIPSADSLDKEIVFRLLPITQISDEIFTFKTDKVAWNTFISQKMNQRAL